MTFAKNVGIAFLVFALVGALNAAGVVSNEIKYVVQTPLFFALFAYALALSMRGGFKPRPLPVRVRSLGSAWVVLGIGTELGAEGLLLLGAIVAAVISARQVLPALVAET